MSIIRNRIRQLTNEIAKEYKCENPSRDKIMFKSDVIDRLTYWLLSRSSFNFDLGRALDITMFAKLLPDYDFCSKIYLEFTEQFYYITIIYPDVGFYRKEIYSSVNNKRFKINKSLKTLKLSAKEVEDLLLVEALTVPWSTDEGSYLDLIKTIKT